MSLEMAPFDRSHTTSYSSLIVIMSLYSTVTEIFSVEYWCNLKIWVGGRSRSLKIVPIDRSFTTLYWSAVVTIALPCTIFELFDVQNYLDLEIQVRGHQGHWKWNHSIDRIQVPIHLAL